MQHPAGTSRPPVRRLAHAITVVGVLLAGMVMWPTEVRAAAGERDGEPLLHPCESATEGVEIATGRVISGTKPTAQDGHIGKTELPCPVVTALDVEETGDGAILATGSGEIPAPSQPFAPSRIASFRWTVDGVLNVEMGDLLVEPVEPGAHAVCLQVIDIWNRASQRRCATITTTSTPPAGPQNPSVHLEWVGTVEPGMAVTLQATAYSFHGQPFFGSDDHVVELFRWAPCDPDLEWLADPVTTTEPTFSLFAPSSEVDVRWCVEAVDYWQSTPDYGEFSARAQTTISVVVPVPVYCGKSLDWWTAHGSVHHVTPGHSITTGNGPDLVLGTPLNDTITTNGGADCVIGDGGADRIFTGPGDDEVHGGDGNDEIDLGSGSDIAHGDGGDDTIETDDSPDDSHVDDEIHGGAGDDVIDAGDHGVDTVHGGAGNDTLTLNGTYLPPFLATKAWGGDGDDTIDGGHVVAGDDGDDTLTCHRMGCEFSGGDGNDTITCNSPGRCTAHGNEGHDIIVVQSGTGWLHGGDGDDTLEGHDEVDALFGGDGHDELRGRGGADSLEGGDGDDLLVGGAGHDLLLGENGDDRLHGGAGADILAGMNGDDVLVGGSLLLNPPWTYGISDPGDLADLLLGGAGDDRAWGNRDEAPDLTGPVLTLFLSGGTLAAPALSAFATGVLSELFLSNGELSLSELDGTLQLAIEILNGGNPDWGSAASDVFGLLGFFHDVGIDPLGLGGDICVEVETTVSCT